MNYIQIGLGKNVNKYRNKLKLTQDKLSEIIDISVKHLSDVERGKVFPSSSLLLKIASTLKVKMEDLFCFDEYEDVRLNEFKNIHFELEALNKTVFQIEDIVKQKCKELKSDLLAELNKINLD